MTVERSRRRCGAPRPGRAVSILLTLLMGSVVMLAGSPGAGAQSDDDGDGGGGDPGAPDTVIVATKPLVPFVFVDSEEADGSGLRGYSIDLWNELADRLGVETEWVVEESVSDIIDATAAGEVDAAIAGISMTAEREIVVDFSHPYFDSGLQVAARPDGGRGTLGTLVELVTNRGILAIIGGLVLLTVLMAHLVWLTERRHNEQFPQNYREGIVEALWWSSVSMVTGGEAVKDIRRPLSRLLAMVWMVMGLFLLAWVTAQTAARLTLNELQGTINSVDDLAGNRVVTVEGTVADDYLSINNLNFQTVSDIDLALAQVAAGEVDAVVYDAPVLAYRLDTDYANQLRLAGSSFAPDPYGIALASGSDLRETVNAELLAMSRDGTLDELHQRWFGTDR